PRERIVAPFPRHEIRARQYAAVYHEAAADTGAENHAEHHARAGARAVRRLGEREAVRVVHHADWSIERLLQVAAERTAIQPRGVRVFYQAGRAHDRPRDTDPDRSRFAGHALDVVNETDDRLQRRFVFARRPHASPSDFVAGRREPNSLDLRAAEVDPY